MKRQLLAITTILLLSTAALAGPIAPTPAPAPVPTEVRHVSPMIKAIGGGFGPRISPGVTQALIGKTQGEYRVTSILSVSWDGTKITASTRYLGKRAIQEVFDQP